MTALCQVRNDAARLVLQGLSRAGAKVVRRARSPHGSDCDERCFIGDRSILRCRCLRVTRVRVPDGGDWLLVFGNHSEGPTVRLQGPYAVGTPLTYGGGFWCKVDV